MTRIDTKRILAALLAAGLLVSHAPAWATGSGTEVTESSQTENSGDSQESQESQNSQDDSHETPKPDKQEKPTLSVSVPKTHYTMQAGNSMTVPVSLSGTPEHFSVSSSNFAVASASASGYAVAVKAKSAGTATITVKADGVSAYFTVSVKASSKKEEGSGEDDTSSRKPDQDDTEETVLSVRAVRLNRTALTMTVGSTAQLTAAVLPLAADASVTWTTSNKKVCTVEGGLITGRKAGTAIVTAQAGGKRATCTVTVVDKPSNPASGSNFTFINPSRTVGTTVVSDGTVTIALGGVSFTVKKPDKIPDQVSLTFSSNLNPNTEDVLDALDTSEISGTFFVTTDQFVQKDDLVRRIVGSGNSIGVLLTKQQAASEEEALKAMREANEALNLVCGMPTRLVSVSGGSKKNSSKAVYQALEKAGYRLWDADYNAEEKTNGAQKAARQVMTKTDTNDALVVRLGCNKQTAKTLDYLLPYLNYFDMPTRALMDSDKPTCELQTETKKAAKQTNSNTNTTTTKAKE